MTLALVVGGDSLVGAAICSRCRDLGIDVVATSRRRGTDALFLDLGDPGLAAVDRIRPDVAFLCAAVTDMRACQNDPAGTRRVNVDNMLEVMRRLAAAGAHLVYLSSSQVFDGVQAAPGEDAAPNPRNEYGAQKLAVERAIGLHDLPAAILRVTKVLGDRPVGVFKAWLEALAADSPVRAASNMALSPIAVPDVAEATIRLATGRHRGIWHLGAADELSYFDAACLLAERQGKPPSRVIGEALTEAQVPAIYRLGNASLSSGRIGPALGMAPKGARDVLKAAFDRFAAGESSGRPR